MPQLFVLSGPDLGASRVFDGPIVLGRLQGCDWVLRAPSVSRRHARVEQRGERWFAVDLDSSNGLHLGGERVGEIALEDGTEFRVGDVELRFRAADPQEVARPAPAPPPREQAPPKLAETTVVREPELEILHGDDTRVEETGEIVLEGEWTDPAPAAAPIGADASGASRVAESPPRRAPVRGPNERDAASARARASLAAGSGGTKRTASGGKVLQYRRVEDRAGLFAADLAQLPAWLRGLLYPLLLALGLGLAWGAFELARTLRADTTVMEVDVGD